MPEYVFFGKVLPERAAVTISQPKLRVLSPDINFDAQITIRIELSQVVVRVLMAEEFPDVFTVRNFVEDLVRNSVDAVGYLKGCGYDVEILGVQREDDLLVLGVGMPGLEMSQAERPIHFEDIMPLVRDVPALRRALGDLRASIRSPLDTAFFCYRAIESVMQYFRLESDGDNPAKAWARMRQSLRIDRSWIEPVQHLAKARRHGQSPWISGEERAMVMDRAWRTVDRFCVFAQSAFTTDESLPILRSEDSNHD